MYENHVVWMCWMNVWCPKCLQVVRFIHACEEWYKVRSYDDILNIISHIINRIEDNIGYKYWFYVWVSHTTQFYTENQQNPALKMASQNATFSVGVGSTATKASVVEVIPTTRNQEVWVHFELCKMSFGPNKARCVHCGAMLKSDSNTTLKKHLSTYCKLLRNDPNRGQPPLSTDGQI
ncbi:putative transcription factor/ chromatin remodeling BED-type(Zn) family [Helianthus annuus]|nr:putative transcription factor/ chromatin remodeling BED-type(Zn) family [Helianthus annuus]